jgi:gamma-D-glutamyl-L-lysine dipeptidyl-peptidase
MPFITVNGAQLYYERYGADRPGRAPLVLIHGSTQTGAFDWGALAPLLAREYAVIVPDCRGHGQSSNPRHSYAFKEMAADMAGLVRALGYERAHIVGHSNGGNVALVTLLEHPDVVQTAILQAANAYISPDLPEKEPPLFDPDYVARAEPQWMERMMALHGPTHGPTYWRDLLQLTLRETISEPNYTPADLARGQRPTLVIQGENDRVNAPARHAQFMAQHIPFAELWIPAGIAHNVHFEAPLDWLARVLDFLARRGDDANEALYRLRQARFGDERETLFDVRAVRTGDQLQLTGQVLTPEQRQAAANAVPGVTADAVRVLLDAAPWALIRRPVTNLRREPRSLSERVSQALLGEAVRVLDEQGEWSRVRLQATGYLGWVETLALHPCSAVEAAAYLAACVAVVGVAAAPVYLTPPPEGALVTKLPFGVPVATAGPQGVWTRLRLPDGTEGWAAQSDLVALADCPRPDAAGIARALRVVKSFAGTPYLWGGRTPFGFDCSGFAQAFWGFMGVPIPRDADQQFRAGTPVAGTPQPGDLLYFGTAGADPDGHRSISHVAISLGGDELIHANGATGNVAYNSLDPTRPNYRAWLRDHLAGVRRFG